MDSRSRVRGSGLNSLSIIVLVLVVVLELNSGFRLKNPRRECPTAARETGKNSHEIPQNRYRLAFGTSSAHKSADT